MVNPYELYAGFMTVAKSLYDGGWRAGDISMLQNEYDLTADECIVVSMCLQIIEEDDTEESN